MLTVAQETDQELVAACGEVSQGFICRQVYEWTENETLAKASDWFLDRPLRVVVVLVVAWIASFLVKRAIVRLVRRIVTAPYQGRLSQLHDKVSNELRDRVSGVIEIDPSERIRAEARAETLGHVLRSLALASIWLLAAMIVLGEFGVNLGPLIAGAGIAGIALGFGAQSIVRDFLSGLFMLIEDHYSVGDMIDFGGTMAYVEEVSLRSTTLCDRNGTVWHVPNGEIQRVGNFSQYGLRARINLEVAYGADLREAINVINRVGQEMWASENCRDKLSGPPTVSGIQDLTASSVLVRVVVETIPALPWSAKRSMEREFRLRVKEALDEAGIEIPFPQQDVWMRQLPTDSS